MLRTKNPRQPQKTVYTGAAASFPRPSEYVTFAKFIWQPVEYLYAQASSISYIATGGDRAFVLAVPAEATASTSADGSSAATFTDRKDLLAREKPYMCTALEATTLNGPWNDLPQIDCMSALRD